MKWVVAVSQTLLLLTLVSLGQGAEIRIAVAANFAETMRALSQRYQADHSQTLRISVGSTGSLYSQITQGAPFDLFFSADRQRPALLEEQALAVAGTRHSYAFGSLVLWSSRPELVQSLDCLGRDQGQRIAIANPKTAPYGLAAQTALQHLGLWDTLQKRCVFGQSIGQTFQFVQSGAAPMGLVARSQVERLPADQAGSFTALPKDSYQAIEQQVVILKDGEPQRAFLAWVLTDPAARRIIQHYGYTLPTMVD